MRLPFLEIDVFGTSAFSGNPLAVIADADDLTTKQMQRIARWLNLSETTFLLRPTQPGADYRVRIFTTTEEYPFAGHPTLGTARAWLHLGGMPHTVGTVIQECGVGLVPVRVDGDNLAFATPPRTKTDPLSPDELAEALAMAGLSETDVVAHAWGINGPPWRLLQLADADAVRAVTPRPGPEDLAVGLIGLDPHRPDAACEVRGLVGSWEDPVTGSLNGALAQWMRERQFLPADYVATQGRAVGADGRVTIHDDGTDIWVGGRTTVRIEGSITIDD